MMNPLMLQATQVGVKSNKFKDSRIMNSLNYLQYIYNWGSWRNFGPGVSIFLNSFNNPFLNFCMQYGRTTTVNNLVSDYLTSFYVDESGLTTGSFDRANVFFRMVGNIQIYNNKGTNIGHFIPFEMENYLPINLRIFCKISENTQILGNLNPDEVKVYIDNNINGLELYAIYNREDKKRVAEMKNNLSKLIEPKFLDYINYYYIFSTLNQNNTRYKSFLYPMDLSKVSFMAFSNRTSKNVPENYVQTFGLFDIKDKNITRNYRLFSDFLKTQTVGTVTRDYSTGGYVSGAHMTFTRASQSVFDHRNWCPDCGEYVFGDEHMGDYPVAAYLDEVPISTYFDWYWGAPLYSIYFSCLYPSLLGYKAIFGFRLTGANSQEIQYSDSDAFFINKYLKPWLMLEVLNGKYYITLRLPATAKYVPITSGHKLYNIARHYDIQGMWVIP